MPSSHPGLKVRRPSPRSARRCSPRSQKTRGPSVDSSRPCASSASNSYAPVRNTSSSTSMEPIRRGPERARMVDRAGWSRQSARSWAPTPRPAGSTHSGPMGSTCGRIRVASRGALSRAGLAFRRHPKSLRVTARVFLKEGQRRDGTARVAGRRWHDPLLVIRQLDLGDRNTELLSCEREVDPQMAVDHPSRRTIDDDLSDPADLAQGTGQCTLLFPGMGPPVARVRCELCRRDIGVTDDPVTPGGCP